jgi:hypothetical protein
LVDDDLISGYLSRFRTDGFGGPWLVVASAQFCTEIATYACFLSSVLFNGKLHVYIAVDELMQVGHCVGAVIPKMCGLMLPEVFLCYSHLQKSLEVLLGTLVVHV